jgi:hypothetical protein
MLASGFSEKPRTRKGDLVKRRHSARPRSELIILISPPAGLRPANWGKTLIAEPQPILCAA